MDGMGEQGLLARLNRPKGRVDVVMDTDAYNEIDDQYALALMLKSREKLDVQAIYAAPFLNGKSASPGDGMDKSRAEILNILRLMGREDAMPRVFAGSREYLPDENTPVSSPAALDLARRAMGYSPQNPLYVIAIGAVTNVASAILLAPSIRDRIVVVWLGGHAHHWPDTREFNLFQDVAAARVLFGCGAAVVQLPCMGVASAFTVSEPELIRWLSGRGALCDYLVRATRDEVAAAGLAGTPWTRPIWDVTAVAWLLDGDFTLDRLTPSPIPERDGSYRFDSARHPIRYVYHIRRDPLFAELFRKLAE